MDEIAKKLYFLREKMRHVKRSPFDFAKDMRKGSGDAKNTAMVFALTVFSLGYLVIFCLYPARLSPGAADARLPLRPDGCW